MSEDKKQAHLEIISIEEYLYKRKKVKEDERKMKKEPFSMNGAGSNYHNFTMFF